MRVKRNHFKNKLGIILLQEAPGYELCLFLGKVMDFGRDWLVRK